MSLNEKKDDEDPNEPAMPQKVQDELVHAIYTSLNSIATQVNNLNKYAGNILGELYKEVDKVSCRYNALHKRVLQLTDNITFKDTTKESSLQATKSKASQSTFIQTEQVYCSNLVSVKMSETHDASVQTLPLNMPIPCCQDDTGVLMTPSCQDNTESLMIPCCQDNTECSMIPYCLDDAEDTLHYSETCNKTFIPEIKEPEQEKPKQMNKHLDYPIEIETVPRLHLMENNVTMDHIQPACEEIDQLAECSSFSTYQFREISQILTTAVGKVLSSPPCLQRNGAGDLKNTLSHVSYGTGRGEVKPQSPTRIRPKTEVFVSPTAPTTPPPLPPDWLELLKAPKMTMPKNDSPTQFPLPDMITSSETSIRDYFRSITETSNPEAKQDFSPLVPQPLQYYETTHDLLPQNEESEVLPPMSPLVTTRRIDSNETVSDLGGYTSIVQSPATFVFSTTRPSFAQSARPSGSKSPRFSVIPIQKSPPQASKRYTSSLSKSPSAALPRHSTSPTLQYSVPPSGPSCSQASRSSNSSPRYTFEMSPRSTAPPASKWFDTHPTRYSMASSGKPSIVQPAGHSNPPQQISPSFKSTKPFILQSFLPFPQQPSSSSSCAQTLSALQSSPAPVSPGAKRPPSIPPVFSKARSALMDAIRKGVLLRKSEDHCILDAQIDISKSEETSILIHHQSVEYNSSKSDKKTD